jgi:hypothetical protein
MFHFSVDDGGGKCLRNVCSYLPNYTALLPRRPFSCTHVQVIENGLNIPIPSINSTAIFICRFNSLGSSTYGILLVIYLGFCIRFAIGKTEKLLPICTREDEDGYNILVGKSEENFSLWILRTKSKDTLKNDLRKIRRICRSSSWRMPLQLSATPNLIHSL